MIMATVKASMAGTVWKIVVTEGEKVTAGQDVAILESMKMEIPIAKRRGWRSDENHCQ